MGLLMERAGREEKDRGRAAGVEPVERLFLMWPLVGEG